MWTSYSPGPAVQCCVLSPYPTSTSCEDRERERERERELSDLSQSWSGKAGMGTGERTEAGQGSPSHPSTPPQVASLSSVISSDWSERMY